MKIIATIKRSAGNDSIGDMWQETAIFDQTDSIENLFEWTKKRMYGNYTELKEQYTTNIILSIAQEPENESH